MIGSAVLGHVLGLASMFLVLLFPAYLLCRFACALLGKRWRTFAAVIATPLLAAWLAWGVVMHPGISLDLTEPTTTCYDRQGPYSC